MATCPNCKAELMEVNGRYICSECGKEVSGAEINVGTWGDPAQEAALQVDPEPGTMSVSEQPDQPAIDEDYIEGQDQSVTVAVPGGEVTESMSVEPAVVAAPLTETAPPEQTEDGFYTKADTQEPEIETVPVIEPDPELVAPPETADDASRSEIETRIADPMYNLPGETAAALPTAEDFYEEPLKPEAKNPVPSGSQALPQDEGIYRDPMYEDDEEKANADAASDGVIPAGNNPEVKPARESTINKRVLFGGIAAAVILIVGGIIAYVLLNAKSNVDNNSGGATATETDCDNAGSEAAKNTCIAQAFTACDVAKWSGNYPGTASNQTRKVDFEIQGITDDTQCQVDETFVADTVNADTIGKTMSCLYDNSTTIDKALSTNSADVCSGDLADTLFGATPTSTTSDETSN